MKNKMIPNRITGLLAGAMMTAGSALAAEDVFDNMVSRSAVEGGFPIFAERKAATIVLSEEDFPQVIRAAGDLSKDVERVTGTASSVETDGKVRPGAILVGTIGKSPLIDGLVKENKLNVDAIEGKWESYMIRVTPDAMIVAGSDKRGTIYGIYEVSKRIGVSPWYWWADVPVVHSSELFAKPGSYIQGPPKVKYRGIFINDEEPSFGNWARANFGGINSKMYAHMFELILRLKGNYLWPAMWGKAFNEDDPLNPVVADEYGVIMGTSHHEPLMRNQEEWTKRSRELGEWNYRQNGENMRKFWLEGLKRNAKFDNLPTVGLRGDGDLPLDPNAQFDSNKELLYTLFHDQRELIREAYGRDPATVPQMWVVFNEIWTFYNKGVRPPEDVIVTFSDSNFGYLLQLPDEEARKHPDQLGLYYHIDMNGGPWNDRWISTRPIPQIAHQLYIAYKYGIHGMWIVNVGDLKPKEAEIDFILDFAWDPEVKWTGTGKRYSHLRDSVTSGFGGGWMEWQERWIESIFGSPSPDVHALLTRYILLNYIRKPEIQQTRIWSAVNYDEADRFAAEWQELADRAEKIRKNAFEKHNVAFADAIYHSAAAYADAFYQLVYYPIVAGAGTAQIYTELAKADQFAKQGRASAAASLKKAQELFEKDKELSDYYNSDKMADGKWKNMMSDKHIGYTQWSMPANNSLPRISPMPTPTETPMLGVAVEGSEKAAPHQVESLTLPTFDSFVERETFPVTLFNRSDKGRIECKVTADQPWVNLLGDSPVSVDGAKDTTIRVGVDWQKISLSGVERNADGIRRVERDATITIEAEGTPPVKIAVKAVKTERPRVTEQFVTFGRGIPGPIVIPAHRYAKKTEAGGVGWEFMAGLGRWFERNPYYGAMILSDPTAPSVLPPAAAPTLNYTVFIPEPGKVTVDVEIMPIFPDNPTAGTLNVRELRIGTAFDNEPVKVTDTLAREFKRLNNEVFENARKVRVTHEVKKAGFHTFKVVMVDPVVAVERLVFYPELVRKSYLGAPFSTPLPLSVMR